MVCGNQIISAVEVEQFFSRALRSSYTSDAGRTNNMASVGYGMASSSDRTSLKESWGSSPSSCESAVKISGFDSRGVKALWYFSSIAWYVCNIFESGLCPIDEMIYCALGHSSSQEHRVHGGWIQRLLN
jgi:hypothetical protein